jgi:hypothetical protein
MKKISALIAFFICSSLCVAIKISAFGDTDRYIDRAKDIVIAECLSSPEQHGEGMLIDIDIKMVLKGDKQLGNFKIFTIYPMEVGKRYLLMSLGGSAGGTDLLAVGELSVVPIPSFVNLDKLKEKSLENKLYYIFDSRRYEVEIKLKPLQEEKALLDKALADRTDNLYISPKPIHLTKIYDTFATDYDINSHQVSYLNLNSRQMEWSRSDEKTGFLYPHDPGKKRTVWEFARIDYSTFEELEGKQLKLRFSGTNIPPGDSTIRIKEGEMITVRNIDEPSVICILKIDRQESKTIFVRYMMIKDDGESSSN